MQRMPKRPKRNPMFWGKVWLALERFPAAYPTEIIVGYVPPRLRPAWGVCELDNDTFTIWIHEPQINLPPFPGKKTTVREQFLWDIFLHEYAHVLDWSHLRDIHPQEYAQFHSATWGVWYAKLYQSLTPDP